MTAQAMDGQALDASRILENARAVAPVLREEAAGNEERRRLSARTVEALRSTGVFRMAMPREWGGPEVDMVTQCAIVEELSAADGAAGWCAMIGSDAGFYTAALSDAASKRLFPDLDGIVAGWVAPAGKLHRRDGGYVLEGQWQFGSGCTHADVILGGAIVHQDGEPVLDANGAPETLMALVPAAEVEIVDTWHTTGLAGSGSHDYRIDGAFVPEDQTFRFHDLGASDRPGTLYSWPAMFILNTASAPLGIARAAIADAEHLLADKMLVPELRPAREELRIQRSVALAHARVGSVRDYMYGELGRFWSVLEAGDRPTRRQRAAVAGAMSYTIRTCRDAIRDLADVIGTASIYRKTPLERQLRDLTTIAQHLAGQDRVLEVAGALWLGAESVETHPYVVSGLL